MASKEACSHKEQGDKQKRAVSCPKTTWTWVKILPVSFFILPNPLLGLKPNYLCNVIKQTMHLAFVFLMSYCPHRLKNYRGVIEQTKTCAGQFVILLS